MPGTLRSRPAGNAGAGLVGGGRVMVPIAAREWAITRPAYPLAAATTATPPTPSSTARRLGSAARAGRRPSVAGAAAALVEADQQPQRRHADDGGDEAGHDVDGVDDGPAQGGVQRDADEQDEQARAAAERAAREHAGDAGEQEDADQHRADEDRLVVGAEVGDRPVLDRGRGVVDDGLADGEDRRGRRLGDRGHEVPDAHARQRGQDAEQGVAQCGQHTEWFVAAARPGLRRCGRPGGWKDARHDRPFDRLRTSRARPLRRRRTRSPRSPSTRPHNRNALSQQLVTELFERLERADADAGREGGADPPGGQGLLLRRRPLRGDDGRDGGGRAEDRRAAAADRDDGQAGGRCASPVRCGPAASASSRRATSRSAPTTRRTP